MKETKQLISMDKQYRTRSGYKVRILATNIDNENYPVAAVITYPSCGDEVNTWTEDGYFNLNSVECSSDLVEYNPAEELVLDQAVWVCLSHGYQWYPRHFAKCINGRAMFWNDGKTSHTADDGSDCSYWSMFSVTKPEGVF